MNWTKKSLLALFGVTALVSVAASASAEDWGFSFWSPQATYVSHEDRDRGDNNSYYGQYYRNDQNRDWNDRNRNYDGGEHARSYDWNRSYNNGYYGSGYDNGYSNRYVQQDRGDRQYYGEHRDRYESDDDD